MNELQRILLSKQLSKSSGLHPTVGVSYIRKNETILDKIPIVEIERYLRKKKLEKIKKEE